MQISQPLQEGGYRGLKAGTLVALGEQEDGAVKPLSPPLLWDAKTG